MDGGRLEITCREANAETYKNCKCCAVDSSFMSFFREKNFLKI